MLPNWGLSTRVKELTVATRVMQSSSNELNISSSCFAQLAGAVEYTDCITAEGYGRPPTSVLDMTLNNLMVRFQ